MSLAGAYKNSLRNLVRLAEVLAKPRQIDPKGKLK